MEENSTREPRRLLRAAATVPRRARWERLPERLIRWERLPVQLSLPEQFEVRPVTAPLASARSPAMPKGGPR
jgi:hypothetical protein